MFVTFINTKNKLKNTKLFKLNNLKHLLKPIEKTFAKEFRKKEKLSYKNSDCLS